MKQPALDKLKKDLSSRMLLKPPSQTNVPDSQRNVPTKQLVGDERRKNLLRVAQDAQIGLGLSRQMGEGYLSPNQYNPDYVGRNVAPDYGEADVDELRAQMQPTSDKFWRGLGRAGTKTIAEIGKSVGYLGALPFLPFTQDVETVTNNFWVEMFQGLEDSAKEAMPVYVRQSVENGSFSRQIMSPEFWATEGADAVGFLLGALVGGYGIGAGAKALGWSTQLAKIVGGGLKTVDKIDNWTIAGAQTFIESAAEAKGYVDAKMAELPELMNEDGTYTIGGKRLSYEDARALIGKNAAGIMRQNMLLLAGPNLVQTKYLFGKPKGIFGTIGTKRVADLVEEANNKAGWKIYGSNLVQRGLGGAGTEAFQEWAQFGIEDYYDKKLKGQTSSDVMGGIIESMIDGIGTVEGQKSVFLGAVLGLGPGAIGAIRKSRADIKRAGKLAQILETNIEHTKKGLTGFAKTDEDGKFLKDKNGNFIEDEAEVKKMLEARAEMAVLAQAIQQARDEGDTETSKMLMTELALRNLPEFLNVEGGIDIWKNNMYELAQSLGTDAKTLGFKSKEDFANFFVKVAENAQLEHDKISNYGPKFFGIKASRANRKLRDEFYNRVAFNAIRMKALEGFYDERLDNIDSEINDVLSKTEKRLERNPEYQGMKPEEQKKKVRQEAGKELTSLEEKRDSLLKAQSINKANYNLLFNKKEQQEAFDRMVKKQEELEEAHKKEIDSEEKFINALKEKGYLVERYQDENGNDDFHNELVAFNNKQGRTFRIARKQKENGAPYFVIEDIASKETYNLTMQNLRSLGLTDPETIIPKEDVRNFLRIQMAVNRNYNVLANLQAEINQKSEQIYAADRQIEISQKKIKKLENILRVLKTIKPEDGLSMSEVFNEIEDVTEEIQLLEMKIEELEQTRKSYENFINQATDIKDEVISLIQESSGEVITRGKLLNRLMETIINGDLEADMDRLTESIERIRETLPQLRETRNKLRTARNALLATATEMMEAIREFTEGGEILSEDLIQRAVIANLIMQREIDGVNFVDEILEIIRNDRNGFLAHDIIKELKEKYSEIMDAYQAKGEELAKAQELYEEALTELGQLYDNKRILEMYNFLEENAEVINSMRDARVSQQDIDLPEDDPQWISRNSSRIEQVPPSASQDRTYGARKWNPWSTVIGGRKKYIDDNGDLQYGEFESEEAQQQHDNWNNALEQIPLSEMGLYTARVLNPAQFEKETGITPPSEEADDLYVAVYNLSTNEYVKWEGTPIYAGIARTESYFGGEGGVRIDVEQIPEMATFLNKHMSPEKQVEWNNKLYSNKKDMKADMESMLESLYHKWRQELVLEVANSETNPNASLRGVSMDIYDISVGIANRKDGVKEKVTDVFDVKGIKVATTSVVTKENKAAVPATKGAVYIIDRSGQLIRVNNNIIRDLEPSKQKKHINTLLQLMTLVNHIEPGQSLEQATFGFQGKETDTMNLISSKDNTGIMDYFINWGYLKDSTKNYAIGFKRIDPTDPNTKWKVVFRLDGKPYEVKVEDIIEETKDGKIKVKKWDDPAIAPLVNFIKSKYVNVVGRDVQADNTKGIKMKMPTGYKLRKAPNGRMVAELSYEPIDYNQHVLENAVHTDIVKPEDGTPMFSSKYLTLAKNWRLELPEADFGEMTEINGVMIPTSLASLPKQQKIIYNQAIEEFGENPNKKNKKAAREQVKWYRKNGKQAEANALEAYLSHTSKGIRLAAIPIDMTSDSAIDANSVDIGALAEGALKMGGTTSQFVISDGKGGKFVINPTGEGTFKMDKAEQFDATTAKEKDEETDLEQKEKDKNCDTKGGLSKGNPPEFD